MRSCMRKVVAGVCALMCLVGFTARHVQANAIVVAHDINTLGTVVAGSQEETFAVNVATFLTSCTATKNLLLFESNPGDGHRDFSMGVLNALAHAGFSVTVTSDYTTPFTGFDALFIAQDYPTTGFLDNTALITYIQSGGSIYLAGGVGNTAATEAAGWRPFLNHYGLAFVSAGYNGLTSIPITSAHPIFAGISALGSNNGQSIIDLGTNPNAQIVQFVGKEAVYAVVTVPSSPRLTLSPPSGKYTTTQIFDLVEILECLGSRTVVGGTALLDGVDKTAWFSQVCIPGTLTANGLTYRCHGLSGAVRGAGLHTVDVCLMLSDSTQGCDTVFWDVLENTEP